MNISLRLNILLGTFVGLIIAMNLLGAKIITLFGIAVSVGLFMVPITFLLTDIVEEVYGKRVSRQFIISGAIALIIVFIYAAIFIKLAPNPRYQLNDEYSQIFGSSLRIMIASVTAFVLAQMHDVWAFNFWKEKTKGRFLWLRNNLSTFASQAVDTFVFMMIAFYQVTPRYDLSFILQLAVPYYLFKIAFGALNTPLVYAGAAWLKADGSFKEHDKPLLQ